MKNRSTPDRARFLLVLLLVGIAPPQATGAEPQRRGTVEFRQLLRDLDTWRRYKAIEELTNRGEAVVPALLEEIARHEKLDEENYRVVTGAATALAAIGPVALPGLLELARSEGTWVRANALSAIGRMGVPSAEATSLIIQAAGSPSTVVRSAAAYALGRVEGGSREALDTLWELAVDDSGNVFEAARKSLVVARPSVDQLLEKMSSRNGILRFQAFQVVEAIRPGDPRVITKLSESLLLPVTDVGTAYAARALGAYGRAAAGVFDALEALLSSPLPSLRSPNQAMYAIRAYEYAAVALARVNPSSGVPTMERMLHTRDSMPSSSTLVQTALVKGIASAPDHGRSALPTLVALLSSAADGVIYELSSAIREIGAPARPLLVAELVKKRVRHRKEVLSLLAQLSPLTSGEGTSLAKLRHDEDSLIRGYVMSGVAKSEMSDGAKLAILGEGLKDTDKYVRSVAVEGCRMLGRAAERFLPTLEPMLQTERDPFSYNIGPDAASAIVAIGQLDKSNMPRVRKILRHEDERVRQAGIKAIGDLGRSGKPATRLLEQITESEEVDGIIATAALGKIRGKLEALKIRTALGSGDLELRGTTIDAVGYLGVLGLKLLPDMTRLWDQGVQSDDSALLNQLIEAFSQMGTDVAAISAHLADFLNRTSVNLGVYGDTLSLLKSFGPLAKTALPALEESADAYSSFLSKDLERHAIRAIRGEPAKPGT